MLLGVTKDPIFLLDENLNRKVAEALCAVDYKVTTVHDAFNGQLGVKDPEIIDWCHINSATWVTTDIKARKQHKKEIFTSCIRCLWIYRKHGAMSSKEQLRALSFILPDLSERFIGAPNKLHYRVRLHGQAPRDFVKLEPIDLEKHI
jgi:predicted nuclease of predicted toxin-antitoxin system